MGPVLTQSSSTLKFIRDRLAPLALSCTGLPSDAYAHALLQRFDLPVPLFHFLLGAAGTVLFSFVVAGLVREPSRRFLRKRPVRIGSLGTVAMRLLGAIGLLVLGLVVVVGLAGSQHPLRNIVPIFVWALWWVGFAYVAALVVDLWPALSPWRGMARLLRASVGQWRTPFRYPRRLESWPAVLLLVAFGWMELIWPSREDPSAIATAAIAYSALMLMGMLLVGPDVWLGRAEVFARIFGVFGRFAPLALSRSGGIWLRAPGWGLVVVRPADISTTVFILILLSTVTFDGLLETPVWAWIAERGRASEALTRLAESIGTHPYVLLSSTAMATFTLLFGGLYFVTCAGIAGMVLRRAGPGAPGFGRIARTFVWSLVPICIAYHFAHYLSYILIAVQMALSLGSDPLGWGWDLFGTRGGRVRIDMLGPKTLWWVSVVSIVAGHVIAVWIAHLRALVCFGDLRNALWSQIPMIALMILYTVSSLWILAQPITEPLR
jgi:hypothetical protein